MIYCGFHEAEITPWKDLVLEGYEHRGRMGSGNGGVLDPLKAQALFLSDGEKESLIIALDVCKFELSLGHHIRNILSESIQIPFESIMIVPSHTHSGPVLDNLWGSRDLEGSAKIEHQKSLKEYIGFLTNTLITIASEAKSVHFPAKISFAFHSAVLGYNRRQADGEEHRMLFSLWQHPEHFPSGLYDADIPVVMIERLRDPGLDDYFHPLGTERIVLFNPAFHPVVMGQHSRMVSADYPGAARDTIAHYLGQGTKAFFLLGASGDTHPFLATQSNPSAIQVIGTALGAGIVAVLANRRYMPWENNPDSDKKDNCRLIWDSEVTTSGVYVHLIACGELAILGISGECFTSLGVGIKDRSPFPVTIIATLANGDIGYIPEPEAFAYGKYEVEDARANGVGEETYLEVKRLALKLLEEAWRRIR